MKCLIRSNPMSTSPKCGKPDPGFVVLSGTAIGNRTGSATPACAECAATAATKGATICKLELT